MARPVDADDGLFNQILNNTDHVFNSPLLLILKSIYNLRQRQ